MQCKGKFVKLFAIFVIGLAALSVSYSGAEQAINPESAHFIPSCETLRNSHSLLDLRECTASIDEQTSNPMHRIFQIIFILFFISPPLIVILLFLIWCEMKKRNDNK
jgi:hypothetical protein